jgi:hypothetical protein
MSEMVACPVCGLTLLGGPGVTHVCSPRSVPPGPSAEDQRRKGLLARIDALLAWPAVRGTSEPFAFAAAALLVEVRDSLATGAAPPAASEPSEAFIADLEERIKISEDVGEGPHATSWRGEMGVLLTRAEAQAALTLFRAAALTQRGERDG